MEPAKRTIGFPLYLDVLKHLPGVAEQDADLTRKAFESAYVEMPRTIAFDRGIKRGDGDIVTQQVWTGDDGMDQRTTLHLYEDGTLINHDIGFETSIPSSIAATFFAGIFGRDELSKPYIAVDTSPIVSGRWDKSPPPFNPGEPPDASFYFDEIVEGARLLYSCAEKKGSVGACESSDGMKVIKAVESRIAGDNLSYDKAMKEKAERERIAQELEAKARAEQSRQKDIDSSNSESERIWKEAEGYWDKAKEDDWGPGGIDPDDVMEVMNRYRSYRFYAGSSDQLENAKIRRDMAHEMLKMVAKTDTGFKYFKKLGHCRTGNFLREIGCASTGSEICTGSGYSVYKVACDYGIDGGTENIGGSCECHERHTSDHGR